MTDGGTGTAGLDVLAPLHIPRKRDDTGSMDLVSSFNYERCLAQEPLAIRQIQKTGSFRGLRLTKMKTISVLLSAVWLAAGAANAQNLLLNGDFNDPATGDPPTGWTPWAWGNGWANHENNAGVTYDGSHYLVAGAAGDPGGGGGFYQILPATAGMQYKLDVLSGADAWWLPTGTMTLFFLDSSAVELGSATRNTVDPADYGGLYDIPHPWAPYSLTAIAPAGTAEVKVEFAANWATGSIWFENASLSVVPEPSVAGLLALGSVLLLGYRSRRNAAGV
jgi:hypothetical protein